jgi:hypothetical protein
LSSGSCPSKRAIVIIAARMPQSKDDSAKTLRAEYAVIEEAARLLREIKGVLPEGRDAALGKLFAAGKEGLPDDELRKEARAAVIRELLEYLQTELKPPPRPRPAEPKKERGDGILISLLKLHFGHNANVRKVEEHGLELGLFYVNILDVVLDAIGVPGWKKVEGTPEPESVAAGGGHDDEPFDRQWCWGTYEEMIEEGTEEEFMAFLTAVREKQRGRP